MNLFEKILGELKLSLNFLNRNNSLNNKPKILNSTTGHIAGRDINIIPTTTDELSDLEKKVLKILNREYKSRGYPRCEIISVHTELEIPNGYYIGMLNDSPYLRIEGEFYVMENKGIRYMNNLTESAIDEIVLPSEQKIQDQRFAQQRIMMEEKKNKRWMDSSR